MKKFRLSGFSFILFLLFMALLSACGDEVIPTSIPVITATPSAVANPGSSKVTTGSETTITTAQSTVPGPLVFANATDKPVLEARISTPLPKGAPTDWLVSIGADGVAKFTSQPNDPANAQTVEYYLNSDKMNSLLQELNKLGVLNWPDETPLNKRSTGGSGRSLTLVLKSHTKSILDQTGETNDNLSKMLDLIKRTVQSAPPRNSP
ncbi:MAG TPA: hypothetical protein VH186_37675 [Chloroflexia bacterium]|nr:hypothetical protein [Chloroflexia bacterium]